MPPLLHLSLTLHVENVLSQYQMNVSCHDKQWAKRTTPLCVSSILLSLKPFCLQNQRFYPDHALTNRPMSRSENYYLIQWKRKLNED